VPSTLRLTLSSLYLIVVLKFASQRIVHSEAVALGYLSKLLRSSLAAIDKHENQVNAGHIGRSVSTNWQVRFDLEEADGTKPSASTESRA
jgi:hypothetical protein